MQIDGESDTIVIGTVQSVAKYKKIDEFSSYYLAEIKLDKIEKGMLGERSLVTMHVYYRNATKDGVFSEHAPRLQSGQKVKLYMQLKLGIADEGFVCVIPSQERVEIR